MLQRASPLCLAAILSFALLGCGPRPKGECSGTYLGKPVVWKMKEAETKSVVTESWRYHTRTRAVTLAYQPDSFDLFQVNLELDEAIAADATTGPRTAQLRPGAAGTLEVNATFIKIWEGFYGEPGSSGTGFRTPPGVPTEGSVTLDAVAGVSRGRFAGSFSYVYGDGSTLACTFDVPE